MTLQRQVPTRAAFSTLLIGQGRLGRHLYFYLQSLGSTPSVWARPDQLCGVQQFIDDLESTSLSLLFQESAAIYLAISDDALEEWVTALSPLCQETGKYLVHFSGLKSFQGEAKAWGVHPVMTFGEALYPLDFYPQIPFIAEEGMPFSSIFPTFLNPVSYLEVSAKISYHCFCTLSGNFTVLLWQKAFLEWENLGLSPEMFHPYLMQVMKNLVTSSQTALTGPLSRGDEKTIKSHIKYLQNTNDPYKEVYRAFVKAFNTLIKENKK